MPNLGNVLKQEIARIARRELRSHIDAARKASAQHRHHIADLRRQIADLERKLAALTPKRAASAAAEPEEPEVRVRFAPKGLRSLRERLGLSAERFGKLIGVTGQSIYNWEHRITTPRTRQLQAIAAVRGIGKREAMARLEALDATPAPKESASRKRASRAEKR